ncbi:MAG: hypothetical protein GF383_06600 [Candidatus Lokiarchaeota archaeon]|nr:hypothetical protein [Candidatus Lokiarchaeota archaeon]MBD3339761.1 hypothetical protein [Candidatus Lokiarchaeota archaeon]
MSRRIDLLRLDYIFSVMVPMLIAIYLNNLNPLKHIDILVGFAMLAVTGNTWNDVIDMKDPTEIDTLERVKGYHPKEIFTIGFVSFILGITLLIRTCVVHPINGLFLLIIVVMVLLYCKWLKPIPIVNHVFLGASHVIFPYLMIKVDAGVPMMSQVEWLLMLSFFTFAITGQFVHEVIDGDSLRKYLSLRQCQIVIWTSSIISLVLGVWAFIFLEQFYFLPFVFLPIGTLYTFRHPTESTRGVKDIGILIGNFLLVYFVCLIILQMVEVI